MKLTKFLRKEVEKTLIPYFVSIGFEKCPLPQWIKEAGSRQHASPFGLLKRRVGAELQLVEIQVSLRKPGLFHIAFGCAPPEGFQSDWRTLTQEEMGVAETPHPNYLLSSQFLWIQFGGRLLLRPNEESIRKGVLRALTFTPEIEQWFQYGRRGPHAKTGAAIQADQLISESAKSVSGQTLS